MAKRGVNKKSCSGPPPPQKRRAIAAAPTTISELPDDVIFDILVRMPDIKSIIRCNRVCKKWCKLILQPCFAKSRSSRGFHPLRLIFCSPSNGPTNPAHFGILELDDYLAGLGCQNATMTFKSEIYIPPHEGYRRQVIGACNGLVCLHVDKDIVVCNPIFQGRRRFVLPKLPKPADDSRSRFGFGFSPSSDEYKVLRCNETYKDRIISIDVCTLGRDDTWRSIGGHNGKPFPRRYMPSGIDFVFVNGALCWLGWDMASRYICYFDVENEELANLSLPRGIYGIVHLGVLDDLLYLTEVQSSLVNVWVMKDYVPTGAWTLKWVVKISSFLGLFGPVKPIKILEDGTVVMIFLDKVLVSHNPQTGLSGIIKYLEVVVWTELIAQTPSFFCPPWLQ